MLLVFLQVLLLGSGLGLMQLRLLLGSGLALFTVVKSGWINEAPTKCT